MHSLDSQFTVQAYGGLTAELDYHCLLDNLMIKAVPNFVDKSLTCRVPVMSENCYKVSMMDSYGRWFTYQDPESMEDTICILQAIDLADQILPSQNLPFNGPHENL